jgi:hypothetical protein
MSIISSVDRLGPIYLDNPKQQKPNTGVRYDAVVQNFQNLYNELANVNEAWSFDEAILTVNSASDSFPIPNAARFGKLMLVTTYSTNEWAVERPIPLSDEQNLNFDWFYPKNYAPQLVYGGLTGGAHTAQKVSVFYDKDGVPMLRFLPKPQASARYKLKYSLGDWIGQLALDKTPILPQFHALAEIRAAIDILPLCSWDGLDDKATDRKQTKLFESLARREQRILPHWQQYIREMSHDTVVQLRAWDD